MKKNILKAFILSTCIALSVLTAGCDNLLQSVDVQTKTESGTEAKTTVSFACTAPSRTAMPSIDLTTGYTFTLTGKISGAASATTYFEKKTYAAITASKSLTLAPGDWTFVLTVYKDDSAILSSTVEQTLGSGDNAVAFKLAAVSGTGTVSVTLTYPTGKNVSKVTAGIYASPVAADTVGFSGEGLTITTGTTDSVTYTNESVSAGSAGYVRFFLYDAKGTVIGNAADSIYVVPGMTSSNTLALSQVNVFTFEQDMNLDDNTWTTCGLTVVLKSLSTDTTYTLTNNHNGTYTGSVPPDNYYVYAGADEATALADSYVSDGSISVAVDGTNDWLPLSYYTVTCSGTGITFTPATGYVLGGRTYSFTAAQNTGYSGTLAVTCGGTALTATDDVYTTAKIWDATTVTGTISVTVTFDKNGGTGTMAAQTFAVDTETALTTMTGFTAPTTDKVFVGWATSSDAKDATYPDKASVTLKKNTTLYAVWKLIPVVGMIYYSDNSYSSTYNSAKIPVGIVCEITSDTPASVKKIMGLKEGSGLKWAPSGTTGYTTTFSTSTTDGSGNWAVITAADSTGSEDAATKYPVFNFANTYGTTSCTTTGFTSGWYVPAKDELKSLYDNMTAINEGIKAITTAESSRATALNSTVTYWSSSQYHDAFNYAWYVDFSKGFVNIDYKSSDRYVRVIRNVQATHTVTFKANGGTGSDYTQSFADNAATALTANAFTREGYTFLGWSLSNSATTATWADGASVTMTGDATLYAVLWKLPAAVGMIYYSDNSYSSTYNSAKTPVGIVCEITSDTPASVKKIMGLKEGSSLKWAPNSTTGYTIEFSTSTTDGSDNWAVITKADSNASTTAAANYPAFNFANTYGTTSCTTTGFTSGWYVPAKDELLSLYNNMTKINTGITAITTANNSLATELNSKVYYWSSSQYSNYANYAWNVQFNCGSATNDQKGNGEFVRVIRAF